MKSRKDLKKEYKETKRPMGVYRIKNKVNGKIFISSTMDFKAAFNSQKFQLEMGSHPNSMLQNDWKEFGADNFVFEIVEELKHSDDPNAEPKRDVKALEEMIMEELQPYDDKGYNVRKN